MIRPEDCEFAQMRSYDDEAAFFAQMGRFFASASVRRDCGGYPLNDGPLYRWFVVRRKGEARVLGFISIEQHADSVRIRDGYLRSEARGYGLFRILRQQVLDHIDGLGLSCMTRVPESCVPFLAPYGFHIQSTRGSWVTLVRSVHATSRKSDEPGGGPVSGTGQPSAGAEGGGHQPDKTTIARA